MARELREVVYVDGLRTAFGRAGPKGYFWRTRADDMAVKVVRELLRRNPQLAPERIDDVAFAATAQVGDQGLTLGRDVALLAGLPKSVPGFAVDRMCAGALTATTGGAGEIAMGAADVVLVGGVEHMGHHPMGDDVDFNPRFRTAGRVTAGNSAGLTDGATAALIASEEAAAEHGLEPKMRLVGFAYAGVGPGLMGLGPVPATHKVLERAGLSIDDIGLFELNEPFAVQVLTWCDGVGVAPDDPRLNPYGGAIACGHPLGATGVRLMAELAHGFRERTQARY